MHRRPRAPQHVHAAAVATALIALLATACASTAQVRDTGISGDELGGDSLGGGGGAGTSGGGTVDGGVGGTTGTGVGGSAGGVGGSSGTAGGSTGTGVTPGTTGSVRPGTGVTRTTPIRFGYTIIDTTGASASFGTTNYNAEQQTEASRDVIRALIRHANSTGGVGGRKLVGYETQISITDAFNETATLAKCANATEDQKVEVMIDTDGFSSQNALSCFGKHRVPLITVMFNPPRSLIMQYRPYLATTFGLPENTMRALVDGLQRAGFFRGAVVGAIVDDEPTIRRVYTQLMTPMLKRIGVNVVSTHYMAPLDPASQGAQAQNAVLDFKAKGVTHVVNAANVLNLLAFANAEQSQDYYMKLGLGDYQVAASAGPGNSPYFDTLRKAMVGAVGVTVAKRTIQDRPAVSGSTISKDERVIGRGMKRCMETLSKELKVDYYTLTNNERGRGFTSVCDHFFLWLDTARLIGAGMTQFNWGLKLPAMGTSYESTTIHKTRFAVDKYDGAEDYRVGRYWHENVNCLCYKALFPEYFPVPR